MREIRLFGHYVSVFVLLLALMDVAVVGFALYAATNGETSSREMHWTSIAFALIGGATVFFGKSAVGLYQPKFRATLSAVFSRTVVAFLLGIPVLVVGGLMLPLSPGSWISAFLAGAVAYGLLGIMQSAFYALADAGVMQRRVLVLGADERALTVRSMRRRADQRGFQVVGFVSYETTGSVAEPIVSPKGSLDSFAVANKISEIVVALGERRKRLPVDELTECRFAGVKITDLVSFMEREAGKIPLDALRPGWMVFDGHPSTRIFAVSKRILDVAGALVLLILSFPVIIAASVAIKREDGWGAPLFYRQTRVGAGGKSFELIKFRSMRVDAESDGKAVWASRNDDRVTNVGRILRKTRIDEIPQLFNVLRGSMSLVGPRPERPHFVAELEKCVPYYAERHRIKPGVTGWAQLMYPYGASREDAREKLQYDLYYLKHRSLMLDLMILLQTVEVVLFGKGAR